MNSGNILALRAADLNSGPRSISFRLFAIVFAGMMALSVAACGDGGLPEYDEDATFNGRPLSEYAAGLSDLNPQQRLLALRNVAQFGVNGLPVRDKVQQMAREDKDEAVRVVALAVLDEMQDPDLPDLFEGILKDPSYSQTPRTWHELALGVNKVFSAEEIDDLAASIVSSDQDHAEMLFNAQSGSPLELPLAKQLLGEDVNARSLQKLVALLPRLDLNKDEKVDFIVDNKDKFSGAAVALSGLRNIGGDKAFDAALDIVREDPNAPFQTVIGTISAFGTTVDRGKIITVLAELAAEPGRPENELQMALNSMSGQLVPPTAVGQGKTDDPTYADYTKVFATYVDAMGGLTKDPSAKTRALAALHLVQASGGAQRAVIDSEAPLTIVFGLLKTEPEEIVLGTIMQQLTTRLTNAVVPEGSPIPGQFAEAVYARPADDKWAYSVADGLVKAIDSWAMYQKLDRADMIRRVTDAGKANKGHPGNGRVFDWVLGLTGSRMTANLLKDDLTDIAGRVGALALDDGVSQGQIANLYAGANVGNLTIATQAPTDAIIAFMDPIVMHQGDKFLVQGANRFFDLILGTNIYYLRGNADRPKYKQWVEKVAKSGQKQIRAVAAKGLKQYGN